MAQFQPLPDLWLLSDARNDEVLEDAMIRLPRGSGFVFRHYHLPADRREERFRRLSALAKELDHLVALSDTPEIADAWDAPAIYGPVGRVGSREDLMRIATVHDAGEIEQANALGVDAVMLSPVFPTRSHPDGSSLGRDRFLALASLAQMPVIALGGMTGARAAAMGWDRWAAIDGLS